MQKKMATGKKSFVLYTDQIGIFQKLTDEQAGVLIKHIFAYCNDENPTSDFVTELAFESIKQQLKRDLKKFEGVKQKRSEAGKKSAEARAKKKEQALTNSTSVKSVEQNSTNPTVNDNVTVNVNDTVNDNVKVKPFKEKKEKFLNWFNIQKKIKTGVKGKFKVLTSTDDKNLKKLFKDYSTDEFAIAVNNLFKSKWAIENNMLTPSHFLRVENFNKYLNQGDSVKRLNTFD